MHLYFRVVCLTSPYIWRQLTTPGDCAELFDYCNQDMIEAKVKLLLQMSLVLIWGMPQSPQKTINH